MNKMIKIFLVGCMISPVMNYTFTQESRLYKDAASMGMGGVGVSTVGYTFSVIRNPAALGLMSDYDIAPFISLGVSLNAEMLNLLNEIKPIVSGTKTYTDLDYDRLLGQAPRIGVNGPLSAGYMGKGFGAWTTTSADIGIAITPNSNSVLTKAGVSMDKLVDAGSDLIDLQKKDGKIDEQTAIGILKNHLGADLEDKYSPQEADKIINHVAEQIQKDGTNYIKKLLPLAKYETTIEVTANIGYGYKIPFAALDNVSGLSLGATVRFSQRFKLSSGELKSVDKLTDTFNSILTNIYQGSSISSDFGLSLRIQNWILGLAVRDAFSTGYTWKNLDGTSGGIENSKIPYSLDIGTSYRFYFKNNFIQEVGMYLEFEDMVNKQITWMNKLRLGLETKLFHFLDLRLGVYDSFITGGVGMGWKWGRIDFAYYRENYFNYFKSDQYYVNFTIGLDNTPDRKAKKLARQKRYESIKSESDAILEESLKGI